MKPILLKLSGLQSYREEQVIDFTKLCDQGVFGIFGPTGSGKSSILDAITLALYGRVERANGGTQGILNHAEQALFVSFTFQLSHAGGAQTYRVERQFKRNSDISVNSTVSRLVHIQEDGESIVLADKANEVTAGVQQVIGLSMTDFTRAVVLPQGKFAEFLLLKGSDRRAMLQRLFHLEKYGDLLSMKVSSQLKQSDTALTAIHAEQVGLGDASEEALQEAKGELHNLQIQSTAARTDLLLKQEIYEEQQQVVQLQQEEEHIQKELQQHSETDAEVKMWEEKLALSTKAEIVRPFMESWQEAVKLEKQQMENLRVAVSEADKAKVDNEAAKIELNQAQDGLIRNEESFISRIESLKSALEIEREITQEQEEADRLQKQADAVQQSFDKTMEVHKSAIVRKEKAALLQQQLQEQLKSAQVPLEKRQQMQMAWRESKEMLNLRAKQVELLKEVESYKDALHTREEQLEQLAIAKRASQEQVAQCLLDAQRISEGFVSSEWKGTLLETDVRNRMEQGKTWLQRQERDNLAAILARQLEHGEECPVCGSKHHPLPADGSHESVDNSHESVEVLKRSLDDAEKILQYVSLRRMELKNAVIRLDTVKHDAIALFGSESDRLMRAESEAALAALSLAPQLIEQKETVHPDIDFLPLNDQVDIDVVVSSIAGCEQEKEQWDLDVQACLDSLGSIERTCTELARTYREQDAAWQTCFAQLQVERTAYERQDAKRSELGKELDERSEAWNQAYPGLLVEDVDSQMNAIHEQERLAEELRSRLEKSVTVLEGMQAEGERLRGETESLSRDILLLRTQAESAAQRAAAKNQALRARFGDAPVPGLIAESTAALEALRMRAREAAAAHERTRDAHAHAQQRHSAAAEGSAAASRGRAETERRLREALQAAAFATGEAAMAALLASDVAREWTARVQAHRERATALRAAHAGVSAKRRGRSVAAEEWTRAQSERVDAQERLEAALQATARAEQTLATLMEKHARWSVLQTKRDELEQHRGRLLKLQSTLKANAFVEFLAEEQLLGVSRLASERLSQLTRRRYALEVDSGGGFIIRDDANGGVRRPVTTLSGGETFLTSLALALALSAQIQLKGQYPLEFFFLDEGFGTLDGDLLDTVITALEQLHMDKLAVGVISHVPELRARLSRKLIVHPPEPSGHGTRIELEQG
ncbi:AAA family ATPase [Paenibacillus sp. KN14-4R]|uniref:AAA family ATPase n=1 Tax=Paenibacillus sp. KN14-4R TaxID=3445773 RepID=UPI003FA0726B